MIAAPIEAGDRQKTMYMTPKGYGRLEAELNRLLNRRVDMAEQLHDAQDGGITIDNTEYILLREESAYLETRIRELDNILRHAEIIKPGAPDGRVHLGNTVVVQEESLPVETYTIVGTVEADPDDGCISNESPLGRALLGCSVGDDIIVTTPDGELRFRIIAVT